MTNKEFDNTNFKIHTICRYKGRAFDIIAVDFEERLIAIQELFDKESELD